jgi:hypothetical protein
LPWDQERWQTIDVSLSVGWTHRTEAWQYVCFIGRLPFCGRRWNWFQRLWRFAPALFAAIKVDSAGLDGLTSAAKTRSGPAGVGQNAFIADNMLGWLAVRLDAVWTGRLTRRDDNMAVCGLAAGPVDGRTLFWQTTWYWKPRKFLLPFHPSCWQLTVSARQHLREISIADWRHNTSSNPLSSIGLIKPITEQIPCYIT